MRWPIACSLLLVACASTTPSWSAESPTHPDAPAAPAPSVATALTGDPAPPPPAAEEDEGASAHHDHGEPAGDEERPHAH